MKLLKIKEGYYDLEAVGIADVIRLEEHIKRKDIVIGIRMKEIDSLEKKITELQEEIDSLKRHDKHETEFYDFEKVDWEFLVEAIARDYKNCKSPDNVLSHWKTKLTSEGYGLDFMTCDFITEKTFRFDIVNEDYEILATWIARD